MLLARNSLLRNPKMIKRTRTIVIVAVCVIIAVPVLALLLVTSAPDATPKAKIAEVFLYMSTARTELAERCSQGVLSGGMTHKSLGFPDPYKPGPHVKYITVQIENPERYLVSASLEDIYLDMRFWKTLVIPAGARIVLQGTCAGKVVKWVLHETTTVPNKYLPARYSSSEQR